VRIPLEDGTYSYAQMLDPPEYAFFELRDSGQAEAEVAARQLVIFRLWVMRDAHGSGRWRKVGDAILQEGLERPALRFNQDPISGHIRLGEHGDGRLVTPEECDGYERAAVWSASHVEDRLRDHFAGKPSHWAKALRPRRAGSPKPTKCQPNGEPAPGTRRG